MPKEAQEAEAGAREDTQEEMEEAEPEKSDDTGIAMEGEEDEVKVGLKAVAESLYQIGIDLGLAPDEAALLTSDTKLPSFVGAEDEKEFKEGLAEAYQGTLDGRLRDLRRKLGLG